MWDRVHIYTQSQLMTKIITTINKYMLVKEMKG